MNVGLTAVSLGSWSSVAGAIEDAIDSINTMFRGIFQFLTDKTVYTKMVNAIPDSIKSAVAGTALSLCVLLFIIGFLGKTMNLQWVTWENVLMLLLQLVLAKICVQNAGWIMDKTQNAFASMAEQIEPYDIIDPYVKDENGKMVVDTIDASDFSQSPYTAFLIALYKSLGYEFPDDYNFTYERPVWKTRHVDGSIRTGHAFLMFGDKYKNISREVPEAYFYFLSEQDALCAYAGAEAKTFDFGPVFAWMGVFVQSFVMKAILVVVLVIAIGRFMQLTVYTILSPLSLATFASDETKEIGKSFLKSFVACSLHVTVIIIVFAAYQAAGVIIENAAGFEALSGFMGLIKTFCLGAMVMKSENISNKICGAM